MAMSPQRARSAPSPLGNSKFITFLGWKKMNTKVARQNLPDDEAAWMENLQPIGPNRLQAVPAPSPVLATVIGKTAAVKFLVNLNGIDYVIFFATDGSCTAINANTGAQTLIAAAATFSTTPDLTVFGSSRILIMDPTAGYATWDGTLFVGKGGLSPNIKITNGGSLYATAPVVSFQGGNGSGATATATVLPIVVGSITVTNPGSNYTVAPGISFSGGGGGSGAAATAFIGPIGGNPGNGVLSIQVTNGGSGYTSVPTVNFSGGGGGTGAAATAVLAGGQVIGITLTNPGSQYLATDQIIVNLTGGGGSGATATVVVWPQITGTTITVGFGRVWWANNRLLNFTGTGATTGQTYDDTNPADAAGSLLISDPDLSHKIYALRFLNNYLYIIGDSSVKQIGSITVSSSITLFNILTLASDIGTTFLQTVLSYNRLVLFANKNGVYAIFGATVQKISDDLDGIFENADFSLNMCASLQDIHVFSPSGSPGGSLHCYMILLKYFDVTLGFSRTIICVYQTNKWFVVNVGASVLAMCGGVLGSSQQWETFVSSGADVTQILQNSNAPVQILLITALTQHNNPIQAKKVLRSGMAATAANPQSVTMTVDTENRSLSYAFQFATNLVFLNNNGLPIQFLNNSLQPLNFTVGGFELPDQDTEGYGRFVGNTVSGSVQGLAINQILNEYVDADPWGKVP